MGSRPVGFTQLSVELGVPLSFSHSPFVLRPIVIYAKGGWSMLLSTPVKKSVTTNMAYARHLL